MIQNPLSDAPGRLAALGAEAEARRHLAMLARGGVFLLQSPEGAARIYVRKPEGGPAPRRIQTLGAPVVEALRRLDWIVLVRAAEGGKVWRVSAAGELAARRQKAERKNAQSAAASFREAHRLEAEKLFVQPGGAPPEKLKVNVGESPIGWLARRKGTNGAPFLSPEAFEAAERLRVDFERGQMRPSVTQDWSRLLTAGVEGGRRAGGPQERPINDSAAAARDRFGAAMKAMGPGLADAAFRACCLLEGLEEVETHMGWSARSGKVVIKIALERLAAHYEACDSSRRGRA